MKLILMAFLLVMLSSQGTSQCTGNTGQKKGILAVSLTDGLGQPLDPAAYNVSAVRESQPAASHVYRFETHGKKSFQTPPIPYGKYRIEVRARSGADTFGRTVDVCKPSEGVEVPSHSARVHIGLLTTQNGIQDVEPSLVKVARFRNADDDTDMAGLFDGALGKNIPYGTYSLQMSDPLGGIIERRVDVFQPEVWIFSGLIARNGDKTYSSPENVVHGKVRNVPADERPVFITMSGLYVPCMINDVVSDTSAADGTFTLAGVNSAGSYLLITTGRSGILDIRELKLPRDTEVIVDLSQPSLPKRNTP